MRCVWKLLFVLLAISCPLFTTGCGPSYMSEEAAIEAEGEAEAVVDEGAEEIEVEVSEDDGEQTIAC